MAEEAAELGRGEARRLLVRSVRPQVRRLADELGAAIVERQAPPPAQPRLRSEYRADPPRVILYRDSIDALAAAVRASRRSDMIGRSLDDMHIAHELFHHLEARGRFRRLSRQQSEEAAHAFARELLGLSFDPAELSELTA
jgi:hypothetical protein